VNRDEELARQLELSGYDAEGFADRYEAARPRPPVALVELLSALVRGRPKRVVDVGSGTGLSARVWADAADEVVGVEPNGAMRRVAVASTRAMNVRYLGGSSYATGLADEFADVVTCSQSLQWMEPEPTFAEIGRILRPGGVFAAYQYETLQTPYWEPEAAFREVRARVSALNHELGVRKERVRWPLSLERIEQSGQFRDCREVFLHSVEQVDAERLVEFALSEGSTTTLLARGYTEWELGLDRLRAVATRWLVEPAPWWLGYRLVVARR
jgi:SAM-dependent methyltransferase